VAVFRKYFPWSLVPHIHQSRAGCFRIPFNTTCFSPPILLAFFPHTFPICEAFGEKIGAYYFFPPSPCRFCFFYLLSPNLEKSFHHPLTGWPLLIPGGLSCSKKIPSASLFRHLIVSKSFSRMAWFLLLGDF